MEEFILNKSEVRKFGKKIAALLLQKNVHLALNGDLGSGKTFLAGEIIKNIAGSSNSHMPITSPTFNIVNVYNKFGQKAIYHFDLYRIKDENELDNIGFFDSLNDGICLIEWPNIVKNYLKNSIFIDILKIEKNKRKIILYGGSK